MAYQIVDNVGVQIQGLVVGNFYSPSANPLPGQGNKPMLGDIFSVVFLVGQDVAIINVMQGAHQGQMNIVGRNYPAGTRFYRYALLGGQMPRGIAGGAGPPPAPPVAPVAPAPPLPPVGPAARENNSMGNMKPINNSSQRSRKQRSRKTRRRLHKKTRKH
uniref:Uncharacterized protein n=1 Tax=viral metagenome TaxID=1070528 RepID=A0A6C0BHU5_9ZZZZ